MEVIGLTVRGERVIIRRRKFMEVLQVHHAQCRYATGPVIKTIRIMGADPGGLATCAKFGRHWFVSFCCGITQRLMYFIGSRYCMAHSALHCTSVYAWD
jgi:hypothetical protein